MEKITYLIANYNHSEYIADCLRSLQQQNNDNWLAIICDDASSDNSPEIIREFENNQIKLVQNEKNRGYIGTLKKLISLAETDLVALLDSDDTITPETTGVLLSAYSENPECGFIYSNFVSYDSAMKEELRYIRNSYVPPGKSAVFYGFVSHIKSFRKSLYLKTSGLDEDILYAEDRDLVYKMEEITGLKFIDRNLYKHRILRGGQSTDYEKRKRGFKNHARAILNAAKRRKFKGFDKMIYRLFAAGISFNGSNNLFILYTGKLLIKSIRIFCEYANPSCGRIKN